MRFVPITRAVPGMVLSKRIYDAQQRVLLGANMELTQDFIDKLAERGLPGFYIEDNFTKDILIEDVIPEELRGRAVDSLVKSDIDGTLNAVCEIVENLRSMDMISIDMLDLRTFDEYTYRHSVNVAILATIVGIGMNLTKDSLVELCAAAILHDIGKLQIDPDILNKPSRLTADEYEVMKTHSNRSYEMIKNKIEITARTKVGVLHHHENVDGTGYPLGLKGSDIHFFARIIHVVDVYDALTTARPYKSAYSPLESTEYLISGKEVMFDPEVVDAFTKYVPIYPKGMSVILSTDEEAVVVENHMNNMARPVIRTLDGKDIDLLSEEASGINIISILDNSYSARSEFKRDTRKRILVIDDMLVSLKTVEVMLGDIYRVSTAKSAEQAMQFMKRNRPDLILMDIDMPGMNGIELVAKIRKEIDDTIPVVFISALSSKEIVLKSKQVNAADYILKPFTSLYLLDRVSQVLGEEFVVV